MLDRTDQRIATKVRTRARAGHAYTLWYVIFNAPESCSDGLCGDDDVFTDPSDHSAGPNAPQIAATRASVVWAGANDSIRGELERTGEWPAEGCQLHVLFGPEDNLRVSEVWEFGREATGLRRKARAENGAGRYAALGRGGGFRRSRLRDVSNAGSRRRAGDRGPAGVRSHQPRAALRRDRHGARRDKAVCQILGSAA